MKRRVALMSGGLIVLLGGLMFLVTSHQSRVTKQVSQEALYYCPMHPTYTSDRPGDCPVCYMKLVKKEPDQTSDKTRQASTAKDICYLHNCTKVHEGRPCPMLVVAKEGEHVTCPICGQYVAQSGGTLKKVAYWTDPMIPGYKSDKPGKSPMGMDLVPVYEDQTEAGTATAEGYAPVLLSLQKQQLIGVRTAAVARRALTKTIRAVGTVAHDPELYRAQAEYLEAVRAVSALPDDAAADVRQHAEQLADATHVRLRHLGLSEELITELAQRGEPERGLLFTQPGEPVWVYAKVYEYELPLISVGQEVVVEVPTVGTGTFAGTVRAIDPMVEAMTRTARIRVQVDDPEGQLKPEMFVNASIAVDLGEVLAIPEEAVFETGTQRIVFVDQGQGMFEPRDVAVGSKADGFYELTTGLADGELVVTSGNFLIDSESRLKAALEGTSGGGHQHGQ